MNRELEEYLIAKEVAKKESLYNELDMINKIKTSKGDNKFRTASVDFGLPQGMSGKLQGSTYKHQDPRVMSAFLKAPAFGGTLSAGFEDGRQYLGAGNRGRPEGMMDEYLLGEDEKRARIGMNWRF